MTAFVRGVIARSSRPGVQVHRRLVDVDEHGLGADIGDGPAGRDEGERGRDDLVAGPDVQEAHRDVQGGGAAVEADAVARADIGGELALECLDLGPEAEGAGVERARQGGVQLGPDRTDLRRQVEVGDLHFGLPSREGRAGLPATMAPVRDVPRHDASRAHGLCAHSSERNGTREKANRSATGSSSCVTNQFILLRYILIETNKTST